MLEGLRSILSWCLEIIKLPGMLVSPKLWRLTRLLLEDHLAQAKQEAHRESQRAVSLVIQLALGLLGLAGTLVLVDLAAVAVVQAEFFADSSRGWVWSTLSVASANAVLGWIALWLARRNLQQPWMPKTRRSLSRTLDVLKS